MKILALERGKQGVVPEECAPYLRSEAERVWELCQEGTIREIYFRGDRDEAVIVLECHDAREAGTALCTLPLVSRGLIEFEIIPLRPYPGLGRLFQQPTQHAL